jgi:hypothetical protein
VALRGRAVAWGAGADAAQAQTRPHRAAHSVVCKTGEMQQSQGPTAALPAPPAATLLTVSRLCSSSPVPPRHRRRRQSSPPLASSSPPSVHARALTAPEWLGSAADSIRRRARPASPSAAARKRCGRGPKAAAPSRLALPLSRSQSALCMLPPVIRELRRTCGHYEPRFVGGAAAPLLPCRTVKPLRGVLGRSIRLCGHVCGLAMSSAKPEMPAADWPRDSSGRNGGSTTQLGTAALSRAPESGHCRARQDFAGNRMNSVPGLCPAAKNEWAAMRYLEGCSCPPSERLSGMGGGSASCGAPALLPAAICRAAAVSAC